MTFQSSEQEALGAGEWMQSLIVVWARKMQELLAIGLTHEFNGMRGFLRMSGGTNC